MTAAEPPELSVLVSTVDTYMRRMIDGAQDAIEVNYELLGALISPPLWPDLPCAGTLYIGFAELSDIEDTYPYDYGPHAREIATEALRKAARTWLKMPHTEQGISDYLAWGEAELHALPTVHEAKPNWPVKPADTDRVANDPGLESL